jgi:EmrB/QacA subfamily drug resistance transporter
MHTLEDDDEDSSRIRKQKQIGFAGTQKLPSDVPNPRQTRLLKDDEPPTSPDGQDATPRALVGAVPSVGSLEEEDQTWPDFPAVAGVLRQSPPNALPSKILGAPSKKYNRRAIAALTVACVGVFFTALDQTVVVTALPSMFPDLQLSFTQLDRAAWIVSGYLLGFVVAMPLMGRVSDIYGRRSIFLLCLVIFGLGSVFCALAPAMANIFDIGFLSAIGIDTTSQPLIWLVAARLIQAVGGGAIVPIAMAVASDFYGQEKRGLALGIVGAVTEAGGVCGPLYGAVVVEHLGWQAIFYLNAPIVIILLIAGWFFIPRGRRLLQSIDWLGAALFAVSLTCLSIGLAQQGTSLRPVTASSGSTNNPIALILAVVFLAAFIVVELRVRWPVVDLSSFRRLTFSASSIVSLLVGAALIIAMTNIPIYVDAVLQRSVLESGLALLRLTVMIPIGAIVGGWLCHRITCRWVGIIGLLFTALGFYLMSQWPIQPNEWQLTISTMTAGLGFGLVIAPISTTAINAVWPSQAGVASALITALRMIGMTLGLSLLTSWALTRFQQLFSQYPVTTPQEYVAHLIEAAHITYSNVFLISMFICLAALIPAFFLWGRQVPIEEPEMHALLHYEDEITLAPAILQQRKRKRVMRAAIVLLAIFVSVGALIAYGGNLFTLHTKHAVSDPKMVQLALDKDALTSLLTAQMGAKQGVLSDLSAAPSPNDGLALSFNLHINANAIQRVIPVEIDAKVGLDKQQNLQLIVQQFKRDGVVADANAATTMQHALNQMLVSTIMSDLHRQFKGIKLNSVHTSTTINCAQKIAVIVLQVQAPTIAGAASLPTSLQFCFKGPIDLKKLLP